MIAPDYRYELDRVVRVIDGDTIEAVVGRDVGFRCRPTWQLRLRLQGIDCPELREPLGATAREFAAGWLATGPATVTTTGRTTFERWLAVITRGEDDLASALVAAGLAKAVR